MKHIAIIGWWAAGMMVAATIAEKDCDCSIDIFEKNKELGTKVRISGWWRCNVTTGYYKKADLQGKYTRGRDFLEYAMWQFWPRKMKQRCESHGVPLHCEPDMRVFPASNKSSDIVSLFENLITKENITIYYNESVASLQKIAEIFTLTTDKRTKEYDYVVITTWWNAYAHTGSSGDGYSLAKSLWHSITPLGPSLNSFLTQEERVKQCSWLSFPNAKIKEVAAPWPILFTHFGISGPLTFAYSSTIPHIEISSENPHTVHIIPFADRNVERRISRFNAKANEESKKQLSTILGQEFTKRRIDAFLEAFHISGTTMMSNISREERKTLSKLLGDGFPLTLIARRPWDEFVTAGWVETSEVDSKTMQSKLCPGLYFAGEVLNIDAVTGWFNFQSCRATWRCAGESISQ